MTTPYPDNVTPLFGAPRPQVPRPRRGEKLDQNITHFVRVLRRAGMRTGPADTVNCVEACQVVDIGNRSEFYHALSSCLVKQPEDRLSSIRRSIFSGGTRV